MKSILGKKIKNRRSELGLSLDKLAAKSNMSKSYIWELENRPSNPTTEILSRLADALDVTLAYFREDKLEIEDTEKDVLYRKFSNLTKKDRDKFKEMLDIWSKK
jgi:transcriptional regulator with XRE-family HTH domain